MSDEAGKRAPKPFEPPPWEAEQFEELRRRREIDESSRPAAEEAPPASEATDDGQAEADARDALIELARERAEHNETATPAQEAGESADGESPPDPAGALDPRMVDAMLIQLSGDDASAIKPMKRASIWIAVGVGAVALVCTVCAIISMVVFVRQGTPAFGFGAAMLAVLAIFCGGVAGWLYVLSKR